MKILLWAMPVILLFFSGSDLCLGADFDGDGRDDIAVFNSSSGKWIVRGVTQTYFGKSADAAAVGDYDGDGLAEIGVYRPSTGLWRVKGLTRVYLGGAGFSPLPGGSAKYNRDYFQVDEVSSRLSLLPGIAAGSLVVGPEGQATDVLFNSNQPARFLWKSNRGALYVGNTPAGFTGNDLGSASLTVGENSFANGGLSLAVGSYARIYNGAYSAAIGENIDVYGDCSLAAGYMARVLGNFSVAIGTGVQAVGNGCFIIGTGICHGLDTISLVNAHPSSLMVGFNTATEPALFVDEVGVGVGMVGPVRSLHVGDVMRLEPLDAEPDSPGEGDLYFDGATKKLRCYDGTVWQDCF